MKVLVTGGSGVVGTATVAALLRRRHEVRLLSRHATSDCAPWTGLVEPREGSIENPSDVEGAAEGCEAVLHLAGIVAESPPEITFEKVNVQGTANVLAEAARADVRRFVYVSSLGAERGQSPYHRSKRAAERLVEHFPGDWLIVRPGNVYGPGDEVVSLILKMVRMLPVVPVIGDGDQPFQPIWVEDAGEALALAAERDDPSRACLEIAGAETMTLNDLLDRLERLTDRRPRRLPLPRWLAEAGASLASSLGVDLPVHADQMTMLVEGNLIAPGSSNALIDVFGITPTPVDTGLGLIADALPEQLPDEKGYGALRLRRYWADIRGSRMRATELFAYFRERFSELVPRESMDLDAEPDTPNELRWGATLTMALPMRGNVQVRVDELTDRQLTCVTLEGHPLAGAITFRVRDAGAAIRFEVRTLDRPATLPDFFAISTLGRAVKHRTWQKVIEAVVAGGGGTAPEGIKRSNKALDEAEAERAIEWLESLVAARKRADFVAEVEEVSERRR